MREYKAMPAAEWYVGGWGKRKKRVQSSALETHDLLDEGTGERANAICMRDDDSNRPSLSCGIY